jgi:hypothetical protein
MKLLEIRSQHRPIDRSEIIMHQKQYDERLKERAYAVGGNLFRQVRNDSADN